MGGRGRFLGALLTGAILAGSFAVTAPGALADDNDQAVAALYRKAGAAEQSGRFDDALAAYGGIIKLRPGNSDAWRDRAVIEAAKKNYAAATGDFSQAIKLQPRDARAYLERGKSYAALGDFAGALADFDAAVHLNPDYADALSAKAAVYDYQRNYDGAIATLNQLVKMQPQNAELYNGRCWERALAGREMKIAEGDCNSALRLSQDPQFAAAAHDSRAFVYHRRAASPTPSPNIMSRWPQCPARPKPFSGAGWPKAAERISRAARPISPRRWRWTRMPATRWRRSESSPSASAPASRYLCGRINLSRKFFPRRRKPGPALRRHPCQWR